ncbi:MAG: hypothetical protein WC415_05190 [Patescibacteria group bacterium]|jgi:hypothetical protein
MKKEVIFYFFAIIGGLSSFYFTRNSISSEVNSILLVSSIFLLCTGFIACVIYIARRKIDYQLGDLLAFLAVVLFFNAMKFGYSLGWAETIILPSVIFILLIPVYLFLIKHPKQIIRSFFWLSLFVCTTIVLSSHSKTFFTSYCELVRGGKGINGDCYSMDKRSASRNILNTVIKHPETNGIEITLSKRKGANIIGESRESYILGYGNINNKIEAYPDDILKIPDSLYFTMPFSTINSNGDRNYYLGLFEVALPTLSESNSDEEFYKFYKSITHLESYFIGKNIIIGRAELGINGFVDGLYYGKYGTLIFQKYQESVNQDEKTLNLIVSSGLDDLKPLMYEKKKCKELGEVKELIRGDGKKYSVCSFGAIGQCEIGLYERVDCPRNGFDISKYKTEAEIYSAAMGKFFTAEGEIRNDGKPYYSVYDYYNGKND